MLFNKTGQYNIHIFNKIFFSIIEQDKWKLQILILIETTACLRFKTLAVLSVLVHLIKKILKKFYIVSAFKNACHF